MTITATDIKCNGASMFDALLNKVEKLTINDHTTKVVHPSKNLQLRNALYAIDDYQFLLSNVLIHPGEKLDMGSAGIVNVKGGDTLSELAVEYFGGDAKSATKRAVLLNPWLADKGRIEFIEGTDKVLIKEGSSLGRLGDRF